MASRAGYPRRRSAGGAPVLVHRHRSGDHAAAQFPPQRYPVGRYLERGAVVHDGRLLDAFVAVAEKPSRYAPWRAPTRMLVRNSHIPGWVLGPSLQKPAHIVSMLCLLYTSDAADERSSVDLGGR